MTPAAVRALELRQQLAKSSTSKLEAFANRTAPDDRLRYEYVYAGAHTLRWSSRGVQIHNLPRGTLKDAAYDAAVDAIRADASVAQFGPVQDVVSSALRGAFRAPAGHRLRIVDLAQIELRVLSWLSSCPQLGRVFAEGLDPYMAFAARWLNKPIEAVTKAERQISKPAVLSCGYGTGPGELKTDKNGDEYYSGLMGYGRNMGVDLTLEQSADLVYSYRSLHFYVVELWRKLETAVTEAIAYGTTATVGKVTIGCIADKLLWIALPAGRRLHYPRPRMDGRNATYIGHLGKTQVVKKLYGGLLVENLCQAIARDVLAEGMLAADAAGFTLVGHVHDELIALEREDDTVHSVDALCRLMTVKPAWAEGLTLEAEGAEFVAYRK